MEKQSQVATEVNPSVWAQTVDRPGFPPLQENLQVDVCIVGAGIAGLTTAYELLKAGKTVVVLDDGPLAGGMTEMTTAHLSCAIDGQYSSCERWHGHEGARLAAQSHSAAVDRIEAIVAKEGIECDFHRVDGYLFCAPGAKEKEEFLREELEAAHRAGLTDVAMVERAPFETFDSGGALQFPRQGQFHPLKYLSGMAQAILREGGSIYCGTHADQIQGGAGAKVSAGDHVVNCAAIVVATNSPINDSLVIHTKQAGYLTYAIGARIPRGQVARALYWDTEDPYHYVRLQTIHPHGEEHELLIVGGEDHKTGQASDTEERHVRLEAWARSRFTAMGEIEFRWVGQVMETTDRLAFIGRNPMDQDNVYIVTGDSGMGMTHGTIAGMLLTDMILGRENPWAKLYDPSRVTLSASGNYAKETLNMAAQYRDWLTAGDLDSVDDLENGNGAIIRRGLKKIAAFRDENGDLHEMSAVCPHLGGIVRWNPTEKTWDCPCHASRFKAMGEVMMGPANQDLSPAEVPS